MHLCLQPHGGGRHRLEMDGVPSIEGHAIVVGRFHGLPVIAVPVADLPGGWHPAFAVAGVWIMMIGVLFFIAGVLAWIAHVLSNWEPLWAGENRGEHRVHAVLTLILLVSNFPVCGLILMVVNHLHRPSVF